jgi:hypothetical protein
MIDPRTRVYMLGLGLAVLVLVINLVRKRQLQERYALLWILAGLGLTLAPLFINQIDQVAYALGFAYPPALLLMVAVIGLLLIIFQLSLTLSRNSDQLKIMSQELGLLRHDMEVLAEHLAPFEPGDSQLP